MYRVERKGVLDLVSLSNTILCNCKRTNDHHTCTVFRVTAFQSLLAISRV